MTDIELAKAYINTTNTLVFLTGKAGTGKTTFLREIRQTSPKKMAIIAPTGVAAINAGGMTIHSLFQLPFGPLLPNSADRPEASYSVEKRELLQNLELLVIDEISMVRPDVLDQIDSILRHIRGSRQAFGGVQLLLIGDLAQLAPIIREEEWVLLRPYYASPYFFSSLALSPGEFVRIELQKVYRQTDESFVAILNEMREQQLSTQSLEKLNERYRQDFRPTADDPFITLTTHNSHAQNINQEWLAALETPEVTYAATIRGDFPADAYPTDASLKLKVGAQVMFVKNDSSPEKRYYNGKIGTVTQLEADTVHVATPDGREIAVQALEWSNVKYEAKEDEIGETNAGSFAQLPLKTAWAITIHKSQGLTFDKAVIDVAGAFTHGQAYVALSRCRTLEGLVLRSPVSLHNIIGDPAVNKFNAQAAANQPNERTLLVHQEAYRQYLLCELFNFTPLKNRSTRFLSLLPALQTDIFDIAEKLKPATYTNERIQKATVYFHEKLQVIASILHEQLSNFVGTSKELAAIADAFLDWVMQRIELLAFFSSQPFTTDAFIQLQRNKQKYGTYLKTLNAKPNEPLFETLLDWRNQTAQQEGVLATMLFSEQTLAAIAAKLPATLKALSGIKGIGPEKTNRYGGAILTYIRNYQQAENNTAAQSSLF